MALVRPAPKMTGGGGLSTTRMTKLDAYPPMKHFKTECYQLNPQTLRDSIPLLGLEMSDIKVELFGSDQQHSLPLYCGLKKSNAYTYYWPSWGLCYTNPYFGELGLVLTKRLYITGYFTCSSCDLPYHKDVVAGFG